MQNIRWNPKGGYKRSWRSSIRQMTPTETRLCFSLPGKILLLALRLTHHGILNIYYVYTELKEQKVVFCLKWNGNTKCRKKIKEGYHYLTFLCWLPIREIKKNLKCKYLGNINNNSSKSEALISILWALSHLFLRYYYYSHFSNEQTEAQRGSDNLMGFRQTKPSHPDPSSHPKILRHVELTCISLQCRYLYVRHRNPNKMESL